jgi:hypothetical protein
LFATGVIYAGGKSAAGVDTGCKLPPASLTPVANLPPVLLTPVANLPPVSTTLAKLVAKFAAGVIDSLACKYLREFSKKFETFLMGYSEAGGKLNHEKNLVTLSL